MRGKGQRVWILLAAMTVVALGSFWAKGCRNRVTMADIGQCVQIERPARMRPDYAGTVIPPNIAPLNFVIDEPGTAYYCRVQGTSGPSIEVSSRDGRIMFPPKLWRQLLNRHRGASVTFEIYVKDLKGQWQHFKTVVSAVAADDIDQYLAYRSIAPLYNWWEDVGIFQRDLSSYKRSTILHGKSYGGGCVNCHTFCNHRTDKMLVGIRDTVYGSATLLANAGTVSKIGTKFGYTSWHPSGQLAVYSINKVRLFFHEVQPEVRDVVDLDSALNIYDVRSQTIKAHPGIADKDRLETYPTWSPDGRYLYFCSAPILWEDRDAMPPKDFEKVRYDLRRISYDIETDVWGQPETILSADQVGKSILLPRISPDGRFLIFCLCDYGCFPIYRTESDLFSVDLEQAAVSGEYAYRPLTQANSRFSESWHSFSSNGRWLVFSSKRDDGVFTRPWFSYIDRDGQAHKPFVLPQEDPTFYDAHLKTFNTPEFTTEPVKVSQGQLARAVRSPRQIQTPLPLTGATPVASPDRDYLSRE